jgi:hypothetical protein
MAKSPPAREVRGGKTEELDMYPPVSLARYIGRVNCVLHVSSSEVNSRG